MNNCPKITRDDVLSLLIGGKLPTTYSVHCETSHDNELINNRLPYIHMLASDLIYSLHQVSDWKEDHRYSAKACGKFAYSKIEELAEEIFDYLDESDGVRFCKEYLKNRTEE